VSTLTERIQTCDDILQQVKKILSSFTVLVVAVWFDDYLIYFSFWFASGLIALMQVDDTLDLFNELQLQHQAVATKTKTLHDACDRLVWICYLISFVFFLFIFCFYWNDWGSHCDLWIMVALSIQSRIHLIIIGPLNRFLHMYIITSKFNKKQVMVLEILGCFTAFPFMHSCKDKYYCVTCNMFCWICYLDLKFKMYDFIVLS